MKRLIKRKYHLFLFAAIALWIATGLVPPNIAQTNPSNISPSNSIPTKAQVFSGKEVQVPDWEQISFNSFPPATESGSLEFPQEILSQLDYDPSRSWLAGDLPSSFMMLGDVASAFGLDLLSLSQISSLTKVPLDLSSLLGSFQTMGWQSAESLVKAIPGLENLPLGKVKPLFDMFTGTNFGDISSAITVGNAIQFAPEIGSKLLGDQLNLGQYSLSDIPGLENTPIGEYAQWGKTLINGVPGLGDLKFSDMPIPIPEIIRAIALVDIPFSKAEKATPEAALLTISGSGEPHTGFTTLPVAPGIGQSYAYTELSDPAGQGGLAYGKRWVAGSSQKVPGGYGLLKSANGGKEPTGMMVYGPPFKIVLTGTNESTGEAKFGMYFRHCERTPFFDFGCTPYFIGAFPWFPARETDAVVVTTSVY